MTTQTTFTPAELEADAKQVYKVDGLVLIALAEKYGATSRSLSFYRNHPERLASFANEAAAITNTKSDTAELRRNTYAAIKRQQA